MSRDRRSAPLQKWRVVRTWVVEAEGALHASQLGGVGEQVRTQIGRDDDPVTTLLQIEQLLEATPYRLIDASGDVVPLYRETPAPSREEASELAEVIAAALQLPLSPAMGFAARQVLEWLAGRSTAAPEAGDGDPCDI